MSERDILIVEDNVDAREALTLVLEHHGYSVRSAKDGAEALATATLHPPHLVITDLEMPVLSGFDMLESFRKLPALADIPVLVVSARHDIEARVAGFDLGADDFLAKPIQVDELLARVRRHMQRYDRERELARQSIVDSLTGVLNRRGIANFYARELVRVHAEGSTVAVMLVDVNDFKAVNDAWGHAAGDVALCGVAHALQDSLRANDRVGRMGGDEFAIVLPDIRSGDCALLVRRVRQISPVVIDFVPEAGLRVSLSLGIASAEAGEEFEAVLARADLAMYEDKRVQKRVNDSLS